MRPTIDVLGLSLKTFGLCFGLAFVASGWIVARRLRELQRSPDWAYEMVFAALVGRLVGARGYWLLGHTSEVGSDPRGSSFGGSGLVWYGGAPGGAARERRHARRGACLARRRRALRRAAQRRGAARHRAPRDGLSRHERGRGVGSDCGWVSANAPTLRTGLKLGAAPADDGLGYHLP